MSKLAKMPIYLKDGVNISLENDTIKVEGPKGNLTFQIPKGIEVKNEEGKLMVSLKNKNSQGLDPSLGLTRAMVANMVKGVSEGFEKKLVLSGVGYRAQVAGADLSLSVGYSHPVKIKAEPGINFSVNEDTITVSGIDKDLVGNTSAKIRGVRPPEPYKGKGIKYKDERIRRKVGKAAKALGAK